MTVTPAISLVVTDLDGTLWDGSGTIHDRTVEALQALDERAVPLLVATGRRPDSAATGLARYGLAPPSVLLGGALGVDLATGEEWHRHAFTTADALAVFDAFHAHDAEPVVYLELPGRTVAMSDASATHPEHVDALAVGAMRTTDLRAVVAAEPVLSFGVIGHPDRPRLAAIEAAVAGIGEAALHHDLSYGGSSLMVGPRGLTKWDGVLAHCRRRGLDPTRVLAIGDGPNDLELLRRAAVACVVADGCDDALALADHVVPSTREGGWSQLLRLVPTS